MSTSRKTSKPPSRLGHRHKQGAGSHDPRPNRLRDRRAVRSDAIRRSTAGN